MWAKTAESVAKLIVTYVLPYLYERVQSWVHDWFVAAAAKRAYIKSDKAAQEKYDAVTSNPAASIMEKANAFKDLINSKPKL